MSLKDAYLAKMTSQFRRWDAEMAMLLQKAGNMDHAARAAYAEQLRPLRAHRDAAYGKLQRIRSASESSWRSLQTGVDSGWIAMRHAISLAQQKGR